MEAKKQFDPNIFDKTPELALFYNLAVDRVNDLLKGYEENKQIDISEKTLYEAMQSEPQAAHLKKTTYLHLKAYLWKEQISSSFANLKEEDIYLVNAFLVKLVDIRNFQSHFYHDAQALKFDNRVIQFIEQLKESAESKLVNDNPNFEKYFYELQNDPKKDGQGTFNHLQYFNNEFITKEGKNFFLSFFLLKSEMVKFTDKRRGSKRKDGEKFQVKARLNTFYCYRDNSNRRFLRGSKDFKSPEELLDRQFNTLLNYLKTYPLPDAMYLPQTKPQELYSEQEIKRKAKEGLIKSALNQKENEEDKKILRRNRRFMQYAVRYCMDRNLLGIQDTHRIFWLVKKYEIEEIEKQQAENIRNENRKSYYKTKLDWQDTYQENAFLVVDNNHVKFRINNLKTDVLINERELKNWMYILLAGIKSQNQIVESIIAFAKEHAAAMNQLLSENKIDFEKYPLVFGADGKRMDALSAVHKRIMGYEAFDETKYRLKVKARLKTTIEHLQQHVKDAPKIEGKQKGYTRNRKNKVILNCLKWYLPTEAQLKPEEINALSIYNYVKEKPMNEDTRKSIIANSIYKLEQGTDNVFQLITGKGNLDSLFLDFIQLKIKTLTLLETQIDNMPLDQLHVYAGKLQVSVPGNEVSRTGTDRMEELKASVKIAPLLIPNGFFKRTYLPQSSKQISTIIKTKEGWQKWVDEKKYILSAEYIKNIPADILHLVNTKYDELFKNFSEKKGQPFSAFVTLFCNALAEIRKTDSAEEDRKLIAEAINLYKAIQETRIKDLLLAAMLQAYYAKTIHADIYVTMPQIEKLHEHEFVLRISNTVSVKLSYKQLDDLATYWNQEKLKKLFQHSGYAALLSEKRFKDRSDQQKVLLLMNNVYGDSFNYLSMFLKTEAKVINQYKENALAEMLAESKRMQNYGLDRIEPQVILRKLTNILEEKIKEFISLRNSAFHTDVPQQNANYNTMTETLRLKAGIPKIEKKDKDKYRK